VHQAIAPVPLDHLKGELRRSRRNLLPADLAHHSDSQLAGALLKQLVAAHLGTRSPKARSQLHEVPLEDQQVLVGTNLTVRGEGIHLHKVLK
jgi:hypothetical protein